MAKKQQIRRFFGSVYNFKSWFGYNQVRQGTQLLSQSVQDLINTHPLAGTEYREANFNAEMARLNLSAQAVEDIKNGYFRNFLIFLALGFLLGIYSIYRFYLAQWMSGWVSMMLMIIVFCAGLMSHFWYFQIKNKKLNCTLKEWYQNKVFN